MRPNFSVFIFVVFILMGCSQENRNVLEKVDAIMEANPDSAKVLLSNIDRTALNESELPYFALLYTQAQIKTDIPLDSDSLISIAYAKYGTDRHGNLGIRTNFYMGEIFFNQEKYRDAMRYYLKTFEDSNRLSNDYWHAKAAERIADLFYYACNYDEAAKYSNEAAEIFKKINRQINHKYTLVQLANIYVNNGFADKAFLLLDSLLNLSQKQNPVDTAFLNYIKLPLITSMIRSNRLTEEIIDSIDLDLNGMSDFDIINTVILESQVNNLINRSSKSKDILKDVSIFSHSDKDKIRILYARYENAKAIGDSQLALSLVDSMLYYQNKVAEDIIQESVTGAQRDFYSEMAVFHSERSQFLKKFLWVVILASLLLLSFIIIIFRLRIKAQRAKLDINMESLLTMKAYSDRLTKEKESLEKSMLENNNVIQRLDRRYEESIKNMEALRKTLSDKDDMVDNLKLILDDKEQHELEQAAIVENLFKEKWTTLDTLCNQYFGLDNSELTAKSVITNIEKEIKKIVSKKGLADIVEATDKYMGGIVTRLRNQCPFLKEDDISFIALLFAGFSVRSVCMFDGITYRNFYVKKSRLIKRIESSDAPDKDLFIEKIK